MYRGQPYIPTNPCKPCKGTGKMKGDGPWDKPYDCTSCNGTGIEGDPRWVVVMLLVWSILLTGLVAYCAMQ